MAKSQPMAAPNGKVRKAAVLFVVITVALDILSVGLIIPVLPQLMISFAGDISLGGLLIGLFSGIWGLMQFIWSPILGSLSDRFGRRPIILLSNLGLALDYVIMAVAPNLWILFVGRILSGITTSTFSVANSYIADVLPPEKRAQGFGMLGAAFGIGFIAGPAIGGILGGIDPRLPFWVAAGLSLVNFIYGYFILPESLAVENRRPFKLASAWPYEAWAWLYRQKQLRLVAIYQFFNFFVHGVFAIFVPYVGYRYGWGSTEVGLCLTGVGIGAAVVQGYLAGKIITKIGSGLSLLIGIMAGAIGFALMGFSSVGWLFIVAIVPLSFWGLTRPASQSLASSRAGSDEQGRLQGALSSVTSVANIFGPILFGLVFSATVMPRPSGNTALENSQSLAPSSDSMFQSLAVIDFPGMAFLLAAALLLVSLIPTWSFRRVKL